MGCKNSPLGSKLKSNSAKEIRDEYTSKGKSMTVNFRIRAIGITVKSCLGLGDKLMFASLPENFFLSTGQKLIDVDRCWMFDYNPYIERGVTPDFVVDLWKDFKFRYPPKRKFYTSLAERNAMFFGVPIKLGHPRLYRFENQPVKYEATFSPYGRNSNICEKVTEHILKSVDGLAQVGLLREAPLGTKYDLRSDDIWIAAEAIASSRQFIGDAGLSWIAACYPRVWNKNILKTISEEQLRDYLPMNCEDSSTHWHDHRMTYYNNYEYDIGISLSYLKI